jgi:putative solute:sodium symporter small subunit
MHPDSLMGEFQKEPDAKSHNLAITVLNLKNDGFDKIMRDLVPYALVRLEESGFPQACREELGGIMNLYLVHNQNALTDFRFLGFPFHYWYTAQFLLILFVFLCVIYASAIQKANEKYDFVEET